MTSQTRSAPPANLQAHSPDALLRACLFFFLSGATALVYEVVWVRYLGLIFGNTTHAVSTVLCAYMAGLGAGSYVIGRFSDRSSRPLALYGALEAAVGVFAALTPVWLKWIEWAYVRSAPEPGGSLLFLRLALSFPVVFIPTFLMGGTLPVLAKFFIHRSEQVGTRTAFLYGLNIAGAVCGTFAAGFWLLPSLGASNTLLAAVIVNLGIGAWAFLLSRECAAPAPPAPRPTAAVSAPADRAFLLTSCGLLVSGMTSMSYQICWTRTLATVLGSSTYAFTLMLGTFLLGLGLGSEAARRRLSVRPARWSDWTVCQAVVSGFALLTLPAFPWIGLWVVRLYGLTLGHAGWMQFFLLLACAVLLVIPAACFGALFPLSSGLAAPDPSRVGRRLGSLYFANTVGNILGSVLTGFWAIPALGIHRTIVLCAAAGAALAALPCLTHGPTRQKLRAGALSGLLLAAAAASAASGWETRVLTGGLHIRPSASVHRRTESILADLYDRQVIFYRDGLTSNVSVGQEAGGRFLKVNGKVDASTGPTDTRTQLLLGHLPHLYHPDPRLSLVIGFGSGQTLAAALAHEPERVDCVEIEPAVYEAADYFTSVNRASHRSPRARLHVNDGRNHLLVGSERYDVIISEPSNPWMAGISYLFTSDFYRLVDRRLGERGVFCQWIHSYSLAPGDFQMVVATVRSVFGHVTLWRSNQGDYLILASRHPLQADLSRLEKRMSRSEWVRRDLASIGIRNAAGLAGCFSLSEKDVNRYVRGARLNTDDRLPLEYSAPRTLYENTHGLVKETLADASARWLPPASLLGGGLSAGAPELASAAQTWIEMEDFAAAKRALTAALRLDPSDPLALVGMGRCHGAEGRHLTAVEYFKKADSPEARLYEARAYSLLGDNERALASLERAGSPLKEEWEYLYTKAQVLSRLGRWTEAAAAYAGTLRAKPVFDLPIAVERSSALRHAGAVPEAIVELEALWLKHPTFLPLVSELRLCYEKASLRPDAIRLLERVVGINPYRLTYWLDLIELYAAQGDDLSASDRLERAKRYIPSLTHAVSGSFRSLRSLET